MKRFLFFNLFLLACAISYSIQVSGNQSGTWTFENNPYEMIGDVTVPAGLTLTVSPGVIVHAMGLYQIIAQGKIMANGTEADSIFFVSGQADPNLLWDGIRLENTTVQSQFSRCRIDKADYGINSVNSPASIIYSHFKNNKRGIQANGIGSANPAQVVIGSNLIEYSQQNAILVVQNSNTSIMNNDICYNGTTANYYGAIQLSNQEASGNNNPIIAFNHIHHNFKQGIIAWDVATANGIWPVIQQNLIENNLTGIYLRHSSGLVSNNTIINNFIPGDMNSGAGVMVSGSTAQPYFEDNIITGNYTGFYLTEDANPCLGNMAINHIWAQGNNTIANNIDANNVMHSIYCYNYTNSSITVWAENNYWDYNNALNIGETIEDHTDNASLPMVDFNPWQNNAIPIYLAGTVSLNNPPVPTATLELVSVASGNVLNTWTVNINEPFQVPVYHDSLVYIVAHTTSIIEEQFYGAFGGTDNPIATVIVADVQFFIGDLPISNPQPSWYYRKFGAPQMINSHLSFPLQTGWFVYAPTQTYFLFREGDFLMLSRIEAWVDATYYAFNIDAPPIWTIVDNLSAHTTWEQYTGATLLTHETVTETARVNVGITTYYHETASTYDLVKIGENYQIDLYDHEIDAWVSFAQYNNFNDTISSKKILHPAAVEPDGTLFPLAQGNFWKVRFYPVDPYPTYFGYIETDSLSFFWIPPGGYFSDVSYRIFDNGNLSVEIPQSLQTLTVPIPVDGLEHNYTLSAFYDNQEHFSNSSLSLIFVSSNDEVQPAPKLTLYPNPFNPATTALTVKFDLPKSNKTYLAVYNLKGQLVWSAFWEKDAAELNWDGRDCNGRLCASGLYQIRLSNDKGSSVTRKLMLIR